MLTLALALLAPATPLNDDESIWDRLDLYGDARVRWEETYDQNPSGVDRHRGRLRFRLGGKYVVADDMKLEVRLSSMSDGRDANNPHWDFGDGADGFQGSEIGIDRINVSWIPCEDVTVKAGKFGHAFASNPVYGEFVWDGDVQPAGAALVWDAHDADDTSCDLRMAQYIVSESGGGGDATMFGVQGNFSTKASDNVGCGLSSSWSNWASPSNFVGGLPGGQGNTATEGFAIWDSIAHATIHGGPMEKTTVSAQYVKNTDDDTGDDTGTVFGVRAGTSKSQGAWNAYLVAYDLEANSVFSPVAQDDTPIAGTGLGTGMEGEIVGVQYWWRDNVNFNLWYLTSDAEGVEDPSRLRFDINISL
jgi:hypothetical protein